MREPFLWPAVSLEVAAEYEISSLPTFMCFKDGKKVDTLIGASQAKLNELVGKLRC